MKPTTFIAREGAMKVEAEHGSGVVTLWIESRPAHYTAEGFRKLMRKQHEALRRATTSP